MSSIKDQELPEDQHQEPKRQQKDGNKKHRNMINRRDLLILVSIWMVGCLLVVVLLGFFYTQTTPSASEEMLQPTPMATYEIPFNDDTAKAAYLLALPQAQDWREDIALVAASANWSNVTVEDLAQVNRWDFRFFSPKHKRILFAVVLPDKTVSTRAHLYKSRGDPLLIDPVNWVIDSNEAIAIWANYGGGEFLEKYPENMVDILLHQSSDLDRPVWNIFAISSDQSQVFSLTIDATNGQLLN